MMRVNYLGSLYFTKRTRRQSMVDRGRGWVVFVASVAGRIGTPEESAYAASKFAMVGLAEALSIELEEHGVHVLTVCPGVIDTPFFDAEAMDRMPRVARRSMVPVDGLVDSVLGALRRGRQSVTHPRSIAAERGSSRRAELLSQTAEKDHNRRTASSFRFGEPARRRRRQRAGGGRAPAWRERKSRKHRARRTRRIGEGVSMPRSPDGSRRRSRCGSLAACAALSLALVAPLPAAADVAVEPIGQVVPMPDGPTPHWALISDPVRRRPASDPPTTPSGHAAHSRRSSAGC